MSALRRLAGARRIDALRCAEFLDELAALPAERYGHTPLIGRIWELRHNFTAYDATYIALAEATGSVLYTCDEKCGLDIAPGWCCSLCNGPSLQQPKVLVR